MQSLAAKLGESRSETSVKQMLSSLKSMNGKQPFTNLKFLTNVPEIMKLLDSRALATRGSYISTILQALGTQARTKKLRADYEQRGKAIWNEIHSQDIHEKTKKQEDNMIPMTDVVKKRDEMHEVVKGFSDTITDKEHEYLLAWILVCLYTRIPPRRNQDYVFMKIVDELPDEEEENANYYVTSTKQMVFNKYKTKKHYGQQVIDVPDDLVEDLTLYSKYRPDGKYMLLHHDGKPLHAVNGITRILNRTFEKRIGATALRHIYLSDKYADMFQEKQRDAEQMAHSVSVQSTYIKY